LQDAIEKADTLIEALGWIRQFRDKVTVIKLGGSVLEQPDALRHVLLDVHFMVTVGMRVVIVHGAGARITRAMADAGIQPRFVQGRRYTDSATLKIVQQILAKETNEFIADEFESIGGRAMTLNFDSDVVLHGERIKLHEADGTEIDLGYVGKVTRVDRIVLDNLCYAGQVPVIPSMCLDANGQALNVNADTAATFVAGALNAEKLVLLSDVNGVLRNPDDEQSVISSLTCQKAKELIDQQVITSGMIPKVEACIETIEKGVQKVHIIDGRIRHSLLLEIYTTDGIGTQIKAA
jgi:acetylglutamate kinase